MAIDPVRWGILGPGRIARAFAAGLQEAEGAMLAAVGSRDVARAERFAAEFGFRRAHGCYEDLASDPEIDAIYVGTPHACHEAHTILCLEAGKHVLCEKPLALNAVQARRMIATAQARDRALMEALWTRFLPVWRAVTDEIARGAIGDVRLIQADFGFRTTFDATSRLFAPTLGGGTLLDLGIYPLNLAFMLGGPPVEIHTTANLGATGVDEESAILLRHAGGRLSTLACSFRADTPREARIIGTDGIITVERPWWGGTRYQRQVGDGSVESFRHPARGGGYTDEAEAFMALIRSGRRDSPVMPLSESLAVLEIMDTIRERWGVRYPGE
jgi:predicted dehydrogenase